MTEGKQSPQKIKRDLVVPTVRVNKSELKAIKQRVRAAGISLSEFQRQALLNGAVIVSQNALDVDLVRQLSAIGNNLNQLTRRAHIRNEVDGERLHATLHAIDTIIMELVQ